MAKKVVLSIDGGGIRGVIPLVLLRAIEQELSQTSISSYVDVIAGTSTGALIVAAVCVGNEGQPMPSELVLEIYKSRGQQMFVSNTKGRALYRSLPLSRIIDQNFSSVLLEELHQDYVFPLLNVRDNDAFVVSSLIEGQEYKDAYLSSLLKAASAVPNYFDPVEFQDHLLADGVVFAKNPSAITMQNLTRTHDTKDVILLSLGTGALQDCFDEIEKEAMAAHHNVKHLFSRSGGNYFRLQPEVRKASHKMDDASEKNIKLLIEDAQYWVDDNPELIQEIVALLEENH